METQRASEPLVRTVDHLKTTTTSLRSFADSMDHLLSALEEFYPFIEKLASGTEHLRRQTPAPPRNLYRRNPPGANARGTANMPRKDGHQPCK